MGSFSWRKVLAQKSMIWQISQWRRWCYACAYLFLVANLILASIPRCQILVSLWNAGEELMQKAAAPVMSCHEAKVEQKSDPLLPQIKQDHTCRCSLASYVPLFYQEFDPRPYVQFRAQSVRILKFFPPPTLISLSLGPEPPYPKV